MKKRVLALSALMLFALASVSFASVIDYGSLGNAKIQFDGHSNFTFTPDTVALGIDFSGGSSNLLLGDILGTFAIGSVTTLGPLQTAGVTGLGSIVIVDLLSGSTLTADLKWNDIYTFKASGGLNANGSANLSNIVVAGTDPELLQFGANGGIMTLGFAFTKSESLNQLKNTKIGTGYGGSLAPVPEPGTMMLLGSGLVGLAGLGRKKYQN